MVFIVVIELNYLIGTILICSAVFVVWYPDGEVVVDVVYCHHGYDCIELLNIRGRRMYMYIDASTAEHHHNQRVDGVPLAQ